MGATIVVSNFFKRCWIEENGKRITRRYRHFVNWHDPENESLPDILIFTKGIKWYVVSKSTGKEIYVFDPRDMFSLLISHHVEVKKLTDMLYYVNAFSSFMSIVDFRGRILYEYAYILEGPKNGIIKIYCSVFPRPSTHIIDYEGNEIKTEVTR